MSEKIPICEDIGKKTTQYIHNNISSQFTNLWNELIERKVPPQHILRGVTLSTALSTKRFTVTQDLGEDVCIVYDEIGKVITDAQKKGIHFACQAAALELAIPNVLGISYENLQDG